eukprot:5229925-Pleurochrysis_carterae.AAC.2
MKWLDLTSSNERHLSLGTTRNGSAKSRSRWGREQARVLEAPSPFVMEHARRCTQTLLQASSLSVIWFAVLRYVRTSPLRRQRQAYKSFDDSKCYGDD